MFLGLFLSFRIPYSSLLSFFSALLQPCGRPLVFGRMIRSWLRVCLRQWPLKWLRHLLRCLCQRGFRWFLHMVSFRSFSKIYDILHGQAVLCHIPYTLTICTAPLSAPSESPSGVALPGVCTGDNKLLFQLPPVPSRDGDKPMHIELYQAYPQEG